MAPLQIKHLYKVSEETGSLVNFPIFLFVFFYTLDRSRAGCIHLNDRGKGGGLGAKPPEEFFVTVFFKLLENRCFALSDMFWYRKTFLRRLCTLCSKDKLYEKIFSKHLRRPWLFHGHYILLDKLGLVLGYGFCIRVQVYKVVT